MADSSDPFSLNVIGVTDLVQNHTNKVTRGGGFSPEGVTGEKVEGLDLDMNDEELLKLRDEWEKAYAPHEAKMKVIFARNKESYLGKKADGQWLAGEGTITANLQFEAEETFLAAALAKNPEPVVYTDNTPEGNTVANSVKTMLQFHADQLALRRKLTLMVRQWSIYHLGVLKHGWNPKINDVDIQNRKIQDFIFDPNGYVDAYGDFVGYLGERVTVTAEKLIELFPDAKQEIMLETDGKLGTLCTYTEWWTDEFSFTTYQEKVLEKHKNQYFKYPEPQTGILGEPLVDPLTGEPVMTKPRNHFASPKKPYTFLSVFSLQEQPHDITGLIEQNIPNQNRITKGDDQIDANIERQNNSDIFSEANFNQETAKQAANAKRKGNPILIPEGGPIDQAIRTLDARAVPDAFFKQLENHKNDLRTSWGIQGITAQPADEDQTARGMILNQAHDTSRIGGGIGDAIEQVADNTFNWLTQLYYVFYDEQHFAAVMGNAKAVEYITLSAADLDRQLIVSVSPDSMKPKDEITQMNLAQALFDKGAIGPKTLLKMVDFPDVDAAAADGVLWKIDPMAYFQLNFPEYAARLQEAQQAKAQQDMMNQAQGAGLKAQAENGALPPEGITEPPPETGVSEAPANPGLAQVPLPPIPK